PGNAPRPPRSSGQKANAAFDPFSFLLSYVAGCFDGVIRFPSLVLNTPEEDNLNTVLVLALDLSYSFACPRCLLAEAGRCLTSPGRHYSRRPCVERSSQPYALPS